MLFGYMSCTITHEVEPRTIIPCQHSFERHGDKLTIKIDSRSESVDICVSTGPNDVRCSNYRNVYFNCISTTVPLGPLFVEVYDKGNYCGEIVE